MCVRAGSLCGFYAEVSRNWRMRRTERVYGGGRREREGDGGFTSAAHVWRGDAGFEQHVPAHLAIAHLPFIPLPISFWSRPLALAGFPRCSFLETIFHHEREERQKIRLQNTKSKINDGDGCAGAEGKEINPAPRSLCPHSWVQMRLWPWVRFGRTLCSGYWIAVTAPPRCIPLSSAGMLSVSYPGFWTMKNSGKFWSKIPSMPIEIMYWMRSRTAKKSSLEQPHSSFQ